MCPENTPPSLIHLDPWASTLPWICDVNPKMACEAEKHDHSPMAGDKCAVYACAKPLRQDEECYAVTEIDGWVCWRHCKPAPIRAS